jgi:predicted nucleic acid-binding Zn ribbon protein
MTDDGLMPISESVDAVVRSLRGPSAKAVAGVFAGWEEAVGPHVAAHARPVSLDGGRLVVEVDEPGWATQLRYLEATLRERLAAVTGGFHVRSLEVRVRAR